jgi:hypothetical protein
MKVESRYSVICMETYRKKSHNEELHAELVAPLLRIQEV